MATPVINFTDPVGMSRFFIAPLPLSKPRIFHLDFTPQLCKLVFRFKKYAILLPMGKPQLLVLNTPKPGKTWLVTNLHIVTFPSVYKERGSRLRPVKGQLWPRTR